jgi:tetratricopeptide (TPR) repeat protein
MVRVIHPAILILLGIYLSVANAEDLPGMKGSIVKGVDYWFPGRGGALVDAEWLASRFAAVCGPEATIPNRGRVLARVRGKSVPDAEHEIRSAIDEDNLRNAAIGDEKRRKSELVLPRLLAEAGHVNQSRKWLDSIAASVADQLEGLILLADIAVRERRSSEAELAYAKASEVLKKVAGDPKRKDRLQQAVLSGLAAVSEARGKWPEANSHLDALLKSLPDDKEHAAQRARTLQRISRCLFQQATQTRAEPAVVEFLKASLAAAKAAFAADSETLTPGEVMLARFYDQFGDSHNAEKWMNIGLNKYPDHSVGRLAATERLVLQGCLEDARNHADKAIQINGQAFDVKLMRGIVALYEKDYKSAETQFEEAVKQSPDDFAARNDLALTLCELDDAAKKKRARELAEANLGAQPSDPEAVATYGWVLYRQGCLREADGAFGILRAKERARHHNPYSSHFVEVPRWELISRDAFYYMSCVANDLNRLDEAVEFLQSAMRGESYRMRTEAEKLWDALLEKREKAKP